jgi:hypothetical protein
MTRSRFGATPKEQVRDALRRIELMDAELARLEAEFTRVKTDRDRYAHGLRQIADGNSGKWGWIAHEALHPERSPPDTTT